MNKFQKDFDDAFLAGANFLGKLGFIFFAFISSPIWVVPYLYKKIKG